MYLTLKQATIKYQISKVTLRRWMNIGLISQFRTPGGHRRFKDSEIQNLLTEYNNAKKQND